MQGLDLKCSQLYVAVEDGNQRLNKKATISRNGGVKFVMKQNSNLLQQPIDTPTYMYKCRQGGGEIVPKHYTVLHTCYHPGIQTNPHYWQFTKSMASLHARTQIRPFGQVDNCVDSGEFTWGSVKIHNFTVLCRRCTDCESRSVLRSTLAHVQQQC